MPVGLDPKQVDWHAMGHPEPIKSKMTLVRRFYIAWIAIGLICLVFGISEDFWLFILMGSLFSGGALAILINWELVKRDYAKNYKKNLRQWKKTWKNNIGKY